MVLRALGHALRVAIEADDHEAARAAHVALGMLLAGPAPPSDGEERAARAEDDDTGREE